MKVQQKNKQPPPSQRTYQLQAHCQTLIHIADSPSNQHQSKIESPSDIALSQDESMICLANLGSNTICLIDVNTKQMIKHFGVPYKHSDNHKVPKHIDGHSSHCYFNQPHGVCFSSDLNYIFVADTDFNSVRIIDLDNEFCSTLVGNFKTKEEEQILGSFEETILEDPRGICLETGQKNKESRLFVTTKSAVICLDLDCQMSYLVAGDINKFGFADGDNLKEAKFDHPDGIQFIESLNSLLVCDTYNHRIRLVDLKSQKVKTLCGMNSSDHIDGPLKVATLNFPQKLHYFQEGTQQYLFFTELNDCVRVYSFETQSVSTLCGGQNGKNGYNNGTGFQSLFNFPYGITGMREVNGERELLVSESDNHCIRKVAINNLCSEEKKVEYFEQTQHNSRQIPLQQDSHIFKQSRYSQATFDMLLSDSKASAESITKCTVELLKKQLGNKDSLKAKSALNIIVKCVFVILCEPESLEGSLQSILEQEDNEAYFYESVFSNEAVTKKIKLSKPELLPQEKIELIQNFCQFHLLPQHFSVEIKLPGIRSFYQWVYDFMRAAQYFQLNPEAKNAVEEQKFVAPEPVQKNEQVAKKEGRQKSGSDLKKEVPKSKPQHQKYATMPTSPQSKNALETNPESNPKTKLLATGQLETIPEVVRDSKATSSLTQRKKVQDSKSSLFKQVRGSDTHRETNKLEQYMETQRSRAQKEESLKSPEVKKKKEVVELEKKEVQNKQEPNENRVLEEKDNIQEGTVPLARFQEVLEENNELRAENEKLKKRVEQMKKEFIEMSQMVEAVINDNSSGKVRN